MLAGVEPAVCRALAECACTRRCTTRGQPRRGRAAEGADRAGLPAALCDASPRAAGTDLHWVQERAGPSAQGWLSAEPAAKRQRHDSPDMSPVRRPAAADLSPPRARPGQPSASAAADSSPPRRATAAQQRQHSPDLDVARKPAAAARQRHDSPDMDVARRQRDSSPPRRPAAAASSRQRHDSPDLDLPRRPRAPEAASQPSSSARDVSPPRRHAAPSRDGGDLEPPRKQRRTSPAGAAPAARHERTMTDGQRTGV